MKHSFPPRLSRAALWLALLGLMSTAAPGQASEWCEVRRGIQYGISGLSLLSDRHGQTELVVVHDNKEPNQPRLGLLGLFPEGIRYRLLEWPASAKTAVDLESITSIPGKPGQFLAASSRGQVFMLKVSETEVAVQGDFQLPDLTADANVEGLSVQWLNGRMVAIWGHRGSGTSPGILWWGDLDIPELRVSNISKAPVSVPFPPPNDPNTRHISDLKLDANGVIWVSATNDPGDSGPFVSAVYTLGTLNISDSKAILYQPNPSPTRLWVFPRKVEAIELVPGPSGSIVFGSDDEIDGGWVLYR